MNNSFFKMAVARWRREMSPSFIEALNSARIPDNEERIPEILTNLMKYRRGLQLSPQEATMLRTKINPPIPEAAIPFRGQGHPAFKSFEETVKRIQSKLTSPDTGATAGSAKFDFNKVKTPLAVMGGAAALSALGLGIAHLVNRHRTKKLQGEVDNK